MSADKHRRLSKLEADALPLFAEDEERVKREVAARIGAAILDHQAWLIAAGSVRGGPGYRERAKGPEGWSEMQRMYGSEWTNGQLNEEVANRVFRREVLEKCLSPGFMSQEDLRPHLGDDEDVEPMKAEWLEGQRRELGDEWYEVNGYDR